MSTLNKTVDDKAMSTNFQDTLGVKIKAEAVVSYDEAMSTNFQDTMSLELEDIVEEKFILDNSVFETENPSIENFSIEQQAVSCQEDDQEKERKEENAKEIAEKKRKAFVQKILFNDYKARKRGPPPVKRPYYEVKKFFKQKCTQNANLTVEDQLSNIYCLTCTLTDSRRLFEGLFDGSIPPVELPTKAWGFHRIETPERTLVYTELAVFNDDVLPQIRKLVTFDKDLNANAYIHNKLVLKKDFIPRKVKLMIYFEYFLSQINDYEVCIGGPPTSEFSNINPSYAFRDSVAKVWRHKSCKMIVPNMGEKLACEKCKTVKKTLEQHEDLITTIS